MQKSMPEKQIQISAGIAWVSDCRLLCDNEREDLRYIDWVKRWEDGTFDALFGNRNQIPTVTTILPDAASQEIIAGRLPILNTDKLFLKRGEKIHFIDKAINMEQKTVKEFRHVGGSTPGLFEGTRWSSGRGRTVEHTELVQHRGILYITNQRIVFQATEWGFDKTYRYLTAITPYSNACEMQFGNKSYCMVVADGSVVNQVLQLIKQRRQIP